ncbi:uncharacterized protein F5Z01DRAFT_642458 [Emericellopsis atlantica]|uniref:Peptide hydrolase n=1 Tax=Emericellopsis atlantica TaxID=2614577 RepID=A0A9P8CUG6_9HYPO|nr:uncharacterized protein F5Z01DRAFT_642458 [Emericellopsis atlantica]KAG9259152.1 hypothetical protein F5Z01DRAFT_642458 [Emericellopsis atlantica]
MRFSRAMLLTACASAATARFIEKHEANALEVFPAVSDEKFLIELSPGETRWVTEEEKWELRRNGQNFMDITEYQDFRADAVAPAAVDFPGKCTQQKNVNALFRHLDKDNIQANLEALSGFHTRYYKSDTGLQASDFVLKKAKSLLSAAEADSADAVGFDHSWKQHSVIVTIPGETNSTVVVGAHLDSTNLWLPTILAAPGADDDGSGTVTILEVLKALLQDENITGGKARNTIEFHWYSAEEAGLLGSEAIFSDYHKNGRDVKAMLQQDMTGYVKKTLDANKPESIGVIMDFVDSGLTEFIKRVIEEYCNIPWVETKCGYACSDHASASKYGYPSAFAIESAFEDSNPHIHTTDDTIKHLSFQHMVEHARMTLGLVYELAHHDFDSKKDDGDEL